MRRRELLVGSGTVVVASLAGYAGSAYADDTESSEAVDSALELVPSQSAVDATYETLALAAAEDAEEPRSLGYELGHVLEEVDDVALEDVTEVAMAVTEDHRGWVGAAVGSFDDVEPGEQIEEDDGWRFAESRRLGFAFAGDDDHLVFAGGADGPATSVVEAAVEAVDGDGESVLDEFETAADAVDRLEDHPFVYYLPEVPDEQFHGADADDLRALAAGFETDPVDVEGTAEHGYVFYTTADADLDEEAITALVEAIEYAELVELEVDRDDDVIHVEATVREPPQRDREAAPDARITTSADPVEGVVEFEHVDGESIDVDELELWLDGEELEALPGVDGSFAAGDTVTVDTGSLAAVELRWVDEDERVYYVYASSVVGRDAFEAETDFAAETVEITYVGEAEADPEKLSLRHQQRTDVRTPEETFADAYETLTAGDAVTVEDVGIDDWVSLELDVPPNPNGMSPTLLSHRVSPPRFSLRRREGTLTASYWGEEEHDADEFDVLIDGEPADVQFADVVDTIEPDATVELGEVSIGERVVVEWHLPDEPVEVADHLVVPNAYVRLTYDDADGSVTATHEDGDAVDADDLEVRIDGEPTADQPADEVDVFEPGDEFTVDAEPFAQVELVWIHEDEAEEETDAAEATDGFVSVASSTRYGDGEHRIASTVTATDAFEADYDVDAETVELTYVGEQEADPSGLELDHWSDDHAATGGSVPFFEDDDTITEGDSTVVEGVGPRDRLTVMHTFEYENGSHSRSIFHFSPEPRGAFRFEDRDGDLVVTYRDEVARDADAFRILADGEETDVQPADDRDTLEAGDEVDLGAFEPGTELAVEWVAPEDPVEIRTHVIVPHVEFAFDVDLEAGEATVEHAGGADVNADDLAVMVEPSNIEGVDWDGDGAVSEGDSTTVDVEEDDFAVIVVYDDREMLDHERLER